MTFPGSSDSDARHRCRRPVSGHGTALLKSLPNGASANRVRSVAMKRVETANRYRGRAPIKHGLVGNGSCLAQVCT